MHIRCKHEFQPVGQKQNDTAVTASKAEITISFPDYQSYSTFEFTRRNENPIAKKPLRNNNKRKLTITRVHNITVVLS